MFNIGDEVRIKTTGTTGVIINKIEHDNRNDYLVRVNSQEIWYLENILELATVSKTETTTNYDIKSDQNKPRLSLVPIQPIWEAIARVREYGVNKYGNNESWKQVEIKRYHDALLRHTAAITMDLNSIDEESGLPHRWHIACNLAFIEYLVGEQGDV